MTATPEDCPPLLYVQQGEQDFRKEECNEEKMIGGKGSPGCTPWRIIPFSKLLLTMVTKSPK